MTRASTLLSPARVCVCRASVACAILIPSTPAVLSLKFPNQFSFKSSDSNALMATTGMDPKDWQSLLHQTNDLVAQVRTSRCRTRSAQEISNMGCCAAHSSSSPHAGLPSLPQGGSQHRAVAELRRLAARPHQQVPHPEQPDRGHAVAGTAGLRCLQVCTPCTHMHACAHHARTTPCMYPPCREDVFDVRHAPPHAHTPGCHPCTLPIQRRCA